MRKDGFAFHGIEGFSHLCWRVLVVIEKADKCSNCALKVDVVFPERIVSIDKQGLTGGELGHGSDVNGYAPPMKYENKQDSGSIFLAKTASPITENVI
jgi:hypothetical protein